MRNDKVSILKSCKDVSVFLAFTSVQFIWTTLFTSFKVGLINFLPTLIFLTIWYLFVQIEIKPKYFWFCFSLGWLITLRLPLTIARFLEPLQWLLYLSVAGLILYKIVQYYRLRQQMTLLIVTTILILFNSLSHISLNSPYTYSFRVVNNLPSTYASNIDNNSTWECPYESPTFMVSCDMRHTIAVEKIFTDAKYDASFSVYLLRFYYGYLSSLIGFDGHRWIASFTLNLLFWLFACAALYKICILTNLSEKVAAIAMLCCASSWGFVSFVGQPATYLAAYAYASIIIWATIEIINYNSIKKSILLSLLIILGSLFYDIYPLILTSILVLIIYKKRLLAILIIVLQVLLTSLWSKFFLGKVLGIEVNNHTSSTLLNVNMSLKTWSQLAIQLDYIQVIQFLLKGIQSYIYGGMILATFASLIFLSYLLIASTVQKNRLDDKFIYLIINPVYIYLGCRNEIEENGRSNKLILVLSLFLCLLILMSTIFLAPAAQYWSPSSGMIPRLSFYTYPVNTIALIAVTEGIIKNKTYIVVFLTFMFSNLDLTGIVSISQFFDYGLVGIYWK